MSSEEAKPPPIRPLKTNEYSFPIIKRRISGDDPPFHGVGLRLAVYQGPGLCGDRKAIEFNLVSLKKWAKAASQEEAHILAVGELFLCGYNIRPEDKDEVSVSVDEVIDMISPIARENNIALLVPYAEKVEGDDKLYDSMVLIDREGSLLKNYRKTQLWGSDEKEVWGSPYVENPEEAYEVCRVNGIGVGMLNCYEVRERPQGQNCLL